MAKRRTHSSIDTLPQGLRDTLTAMIVDGQWPIERHGGAGKPTYDDVVQYCTTRGYAVSRSAVGRWAKGLLAFERMRSAAGIARKVMGDLTAEAATETQKAAAEIMTAQIIELISGEDLTAKEMHLVSKAISDCTNVAHKADQYIRSQVAQKAKAAEQQIEQIAAQKKLDPETLRQIKEQIYGIVQ